MNQNCWGKNLHISDLYYTEINGRKKKTDLNDGFLCFSWTETVRNDIRFIWSFSLVWILESCHCTDVEANEYSMGQLCDTTWKFIKLVFTIIHLGSTRVSDFATNYQQMNAYVLHIFQAIYYGLPHQLFCHILISEEIHWFCQFSTKKIIKCVIAKNAD